MRYRRAFVPGGCFFFTLVTEKRLPILADAGTIEVLRGAFRTVRQSRPFVVEAVVVLPDHLHCIWSLPPGDTDFALRWRLIKTWFTKHCEPELHGVCDKSRRGRGKQAVWQHRYWEHAIRDEIDFQHHVDYIHYNPVKHGLAASPKDWLYSSFHQFVEAGFYSEDWGADWVELIDIGKE